MRRCSLLIFLLFFFSCGPDLSTVQQNLEANSLSPGGQLTLNAYLTSSNGQYRFYLQNDGNLVLRTWPTETVLWASGTNGKGGVRFVVQYDGNLVLYTASHAPVWASNTVGSKATVLKLEDNGSLALYRDTTSVWSKGPPPPPPEDSFTIAVIGDSQVLALNDTGKNKFITMMQFVAGLNPAFVISVGDMTSNGNVDTEWSRIKAGYNVLKNASIPYAPCKGNHDGTAINKWFPISEFSGSPTWGGSKSGGIENAFYLFSAGSVNFVLVLTQEPYSSSAANWANTIFARYPDRRGVFATHNIPPGSGIQTGVVQHNNNIFMAVTGHDCRSDGEDSWTTTSPNGSTQHILMTDYQCRSNGGAFVRLYNFRPSTNQICAQTYNSTAQAYETDSDSQFCFGF